MQPPKDLCMEVRVLKDCGEIYLPESGAVTLKKNMVVHLPRQDIDYLIKRELATQT